MFGENLKMLRKQKGFSQEELAARLHVVRQTISKWEKGLSIPDPEMLIRLAEILEVSVSDRRSRRIWKIIGIVLAAMVGVIFLIVVAMVVFFSVPNLNLNPENIRTTVSNEVITKPVE